MTDSDHGAQNALAECINGILKRELLLMLTFQDFNEALRVTKQAINTYNTLRVHGSLKGLTPEEAHSGTIGQDIGKWVSEIVSFCVPPYIASSRTAHL
jgi:hypothetical protein